ncbi:MAG: septum formation protein Maf [Flavobacteriales bacterium]|nr:septum formation protein Maf [Bacteroidota bacterium]MCB9239748.1 septum formation protein Maf [Flavobacteriales bacterium]
MVKSNTIPGLPDCEYVLGSASPRRRQLLGGLGIEFKQISIDADESFSADMPINEVAEHLAVRKSNVYANLQPNELLITADTVVILGDAIINKPEDEDAAKSMIHRLSGEEHTVITGVCLRTLDKQHAFSEYTQVSFDPLPPEMVDFYVDTFKPLDKAGAYGIQEWIGYVGIKGIRGCYYNVMGLPLRSLYQALCAF